MRIIPDEEQKDRKVLQKYLKEKGIDVKLYEIRSTSSWNDSEYEVTGRIYHVDDLKYVQYGPDWYKYHEYKDIDGFRVSISYHVFGGHTSGIRYLSLGCEDVFVWKRRTAQYKKMTEPQMDRIVASYVKEYVEKGCPGNANIKVLSSSIKYELSKCYLLQWWERKSK